MELHRTLGRLQGILSVTAVFVAAVVVPGLLTGPAAADPAPPLQRPTGVVTADLLPTAQIDGVAWTQLIVNNTVYVGGSFAKARPSGSAAGQNQVTRNNLLAYNVDTGALTSFAPSLNAQVRALAASPDGTRLYVGGSFTTSDGVTRNRIAAYDTATGKLVTSFAPGVDATVSAIVATSTTVYVGGAFSATAGQRRQRLAAYSASNGTLLGWAPSADATITAMVLTPDKTKVIVGGAFMNVNGAAAIGIAAVDAASGQSRPWSTNQVVRDGGPNAAILSLSTDGTAIYGGGYVFGPGGNLEGTFKADPNTGAVQWLEDCHGDTYGVYASPAALYQVGHSHYCGNDFGWPQPAVWNFNRATAFTKNATGTLARDPFGNYANFGGLATPSLVSWFPRLDVGTYTGKSQAAWSVTGNASYVVLGGEFLKVNGTAQQGLARFAVRPIASGKQGPRVSGALFAPTLSSQTPGTVRVRFTANWDRDDRALTYRVYRDGSTGTPIYTTTKDSSEWDRPAIGFLDTGQQAGTSHTYRVSVVDGDNNLVWGDSKSIVVAGTGALGSYGQTVLSQGANLYWPLNETSGSLAADYAGVNDAALDTGVTKGAPGAIAAGTAMTFSGASGGDLASSGTLTSPASFTAVAWFKTTSTSGGRIFGFSDLKTGSSAHRDRHLFMSNSGKLSFGVWTATASSTTAGAASYNDGQWHQAVTTLGSNGIALYVDGQRVNGRPEITKGQTYPGYWRLGGDSTAGWTAAGSSSYFAGSIDDFSVYPTVLTAQQISAQYAAGKQAVGAQNGAATARTAAAADGAAAATPAQTFTAPSILGAPSPDASTDAALATETAVATETVPAP